MAAVLVALTLGSVLQGAATMAVGRIVASAVERRLGGSVRADVRALPFWQLMSGRFDHLTVVGKDLRSGDLAIAHVQATWSDGQVDMAALERGEAPRAWIQGGRLRVEIDLTASALRAIAPRSGALEVTRLTLRPPDVLVSGRLRFDGLALPFRATGRPAVVDGGNVLVFLVTVLNAGPIVLRYALGLPVVDLRRTALSGALWVTGARVERDHVVVVLASRPRRTATGRAALS